MPAGQWADLILSAKGGGQEKGPASHVSANSMSVWRLWSRRACCLGVFGMCCLGVFGMRCLGVFGMCCLGVFGMLGVLGVLGVRPAVVLPL